MALLKNCEVHYVRCDPKRPNGSFNPKNPTWECQIRTADLEQKKEWESLGMRPKLLIGKEGAENEGEPILNAAGKKQWRVNLKKKSITKDGEKASVPAVVSGGLEPIDPNTVGNGSIAHVRIYQYTFTDKAGVAQKVAVLMGLQMKKHLFFTPISHDDDFEPEESEMVMPDEGEGGEEGGEGGEQSLAPNAKKTPAPSPKTADSRPEEAF